TWFSNRDSANTLSRPDALLCSARAPPPRQASRVASARSRCQKRGSATINRHSQRAFPTRPGVDISQQLIALLQIIIIDFVLAGDNAIVVGMAASRVAPHLRAKVIFWGVGGAVILRILFALVATQLLAIVGLTLAGGILLLWVCWKMYREIAET